MVSTQDFAHEVWLSLENIRERLAVVETEVRHTRRDLLRLEAAFISHAGDHQHGHSDDVGHGRNGGGITIKFSRKVLGLTGGLVAVLAGAGKALGWW